MKPALDPSHLDPTGQRFRHPSGDILDFHPANPGKPKNTWGGKDHWHHNGKKPHLPPGAVIPDPVPPEVVEPDPESTWIPPQLEPATCIPPPPTSTINEPNWAVDVGTTLIIWGTGITVAVIADDVTVVLVADDVALVGSVPAALLGVTLVWVGGGWEEVNPD